MRKSVAGSLIVDEPVYVCSECGQATTGFGPDQCQVRGRGGEEFAGIA